MQQPTTTTATSFIAAVCDDVLALVLKFAAYGDIATLRAANHEWRECVDRLCRGEEGDADVAAKWFPFSNELRAVSHPYTGFVFHETAQVPEPQLQSAVQEWNAINTRWCADLEEGSYRVKKPLSFVEFPPSIGAWLEHQWSVAGSRLVSGDG